MESSSRRVQEQRKRQDEIREKIALLQAQLVDLPDEDRPKRKSEGKPSRATVLAPATPSPKKKRKLDTPKDPDSLRQVAKTLDFKLHHERPVASISLSMGKGRTAKRNIAEPAPSNLLNKLAAITSGMSSKGDDIFGEGEIDKPPRSMSFTDTAASLSTNSKRNKDLTVIEDIEPGPYEHNPPLDDPNFERLEPHSSIRLMSRSVPHEDICEYMRGRFYLSPSKLYSCVRLSADKQSYDVPVPGDWVTITVVVEMGEVKYTRPPVAIGPDGDEPKKFGKHRDNKGKTKEERGDQEEDGNPARFGGKRYINIRLVDFGARSGGSETGGTSVIRGDAFLSLLLFESDRFEWLEPGDDEQDGRRKKRQKIFKGGSKGAFEAMHKIRQGDVVALLNPRVLKPFQRSSTDTSSRFLTTNTLAVTPESAGAIILVGRSRDLGRCNSRKKDGQLCGSWCDTRVSEVCEWHMQQAVQSRRAARAEFSAGTMGMSTSAANKGKRQGSDFDPDKQWGMLPNSSSTGGGTTYVLSGHVISSSQSDTFVGERIGREAQARAQRKAAGQEVEKVLKQLMDKDKDGMRSVLRAREAGGIKPKDERKQKKDEVVTEEAKPMKSQGYSTKVIKGIGFDPSALSINVAGGSKKRIENGTAIDKLEMLAKLQEVKKGRGINLKPRPGERVRSGVVAPDKPVEKGPEEELVDLDDM
ncbi:hypothetical protein AX15_005756 [Amanita polypyramis BW_CC]|nr:hypothetical protein AX15_005756 [Amanita polypyramis BW_CC]